MMTGVISAVGNRIQNRWPEHLALATSHRWDIEGRVGVTLLER